MHRIVIWLASTVTVLVLLFGYHTSTNSSSTAQGTASSSVPHPSATTPNSSASSPSASATPSASASPSSGTKTYTGDVVQTRWGPVEVEITVADGRITKVSVLQSPSGNPKDIEINDYALPILIQDTLDAQSAKIDMVSGATVTSDGYISSLQSALDDAGI